MTGYNRSMDPKASATEVRPAGLTQMTSDQPDTSLQAASRPLTSMGSHTAAPNRLGSPPATAGHTMGSKPGMKDPSSPGRRATGVTHR